ncbi:MAG TPA: c-type cytochrome, partial [Gemmatimonadaceae bacterium]|nr:c-type cytochrome [Gemmatimonadaceae bacterium]
MLVALLGVGAASRDAQGQGDSTHAVQLAQGKQLVTTVCAACHTEQPPPKLAPPLAHVSRRYRMMHKGDREQALARIVAWI